MLSFSFDAPIIVSLLIFQKKTLLLANICKYKVQKIFTKIHCSLHANIHVHIYTNASVLYEFCLPFISCRKKRLRNRSYSHEILDKLSAQSGVEISVSFMVGLAIFIIYYCASYFSRLSLKLRQLRFCCSNTAHLRQNHLFVGLVFSLHVSSQ